MSERCSVVYRFRSFAQVRVTLFNSKFDDYRGTIQQGRVYTFSRLVPRLSKSRACGNEVELNVDYRCSECVADAAPFERVAHGAAAPAPARAAHAAAVPVVAVAAGAAAALPPILVEDALGMPFGRPLEGCIRLRVCVKQITGARVMTLDCEDQRGRMVRCTNIVYKHMRLHVFAFTAGCAHRACVHVSCCLPLPRVPNCGAGARHALLFDVRHVPCHHPGGPGVHVLAPGSASLLQPRVRQRGRAEYEPQLLVLRDRRRAV